jgi:hypothetical protein
MILEIPGWNYIFIILILLQPELLHIYLNMWVFNIAPSVKGDPRGDVGPQR